MTRLPTPLHRPYSRSRREYGPQSIPGLVERWPIAGGRLYTDSAATTPAGATDPLGALKGARGTLDFLQATTAKKPTIDADGPALRFDMVDDLLQANYALSMSSRWAMAMAVWGRDDSDKIVLRAIGGGFTNLAAEFGVQGAAGDNRQLTVPANFTPDNWLFADIFQADWASADGIAHPEGTFYADATNSIEWGKNAAGALYVTVIANGTTKTATLTKTIAAGAWVFLGARLNGGTLTIYADTDSDGDVSDNTATATSVPASTGASWTYHHMANQAVSLFGEGASNLLITNDGSSAAPIIDRFNAGAGMAIEDWAARFHDVSGLQYRESIVLYGPYDYDGTAASQFVTDVIPSLRVGDTHALVGVCPETLPAGMSELAGTHTASDDFGNYLVDNSQSVMVWVPRFYYRISYNAAAPYYGTKIEISARPRDGFVIHRAFIDGDKYHRGFFVDKYLWSNAAADGTDHTDTTGGIAASIKNRRPVSTNTANNRISYLTGNSQTPTDTYGGCYAAAKSRGNNFAVISMFCRSALAMLSFAHAQALLDGAGAPITGATGKAAWMDVAPYAPKGCNNNALKDAQDAAVIYTTSGYSNQGLTGSGSPFAKTTHNGQACGVADLNGNMWEVCAGLTNVGGPTAATYYMLKESIALKDLVDATSGALGAFAADPYDLMPEVWWTDAAAWYYYGNGTNQVLSGETVRTALGYLLTACGLMQDANAGSTSQVATNRFGGDGQYRKHTNLLAPIAGGAWADGSGAGVWTLYVDYSRPISFPSVGSRAVLYV